MNRTAFLSALRTEIVATYGQPIEGATLMQWACDPAKLERFMVHTEQTLETTRNLVMIDSPCFVRAWRAIGGKGKPTFKALRALPVA